MRNVPGNMLDVDTSFPDIRGKDQDRINQEMLDHLYMLQEQLRYTLANLGQENFNDASFRDIQEIIRKPVYARIENDEGKLLELSTQAEGLIVRAKDLEGNLSTLSQTVYGMRLEVSNSGSRSTISLTANGTEISSANIVITGFVTFSSLSGSGTTTINGDNIVTGTIRAIDIEGCNFTTILKADGTISGRMNFCYLNENNLAGGMRLDNQGAGTSYEGKYRLYLYTAETAGQAFNLKIESAARLSMEAVGYMYISGDSTVAIESARDLRLGGDVYINGEPLSDAISGAMSETISALNARISALENSNG